MSTTRDGFLRRLSDTGAAGDTVALVDWAATPLGPIAGWPAHLSVPAMLILGSSQPMWMAWGDGMTTIYNDACASVVGRRRHPAALGRAAPDVWADVWSQIEEAATQALREGHATSAADIRFLAERDAGADETFYSFAFSPLRDDSGRMAGILCMLADTTAGGVGARRLTTLSRLADPAADAAGGRWGAAATAIASNPDDIPFALIYQIDGGRTHACLERAIGLDGVDRFRPTRLPLAPVDATSGLWPVAQVVSSGRRQVVDVASTGGLPATAAGLTPSTAVVLPLRARESGQVDGILIAGVSPVRPLDADYHAFFGLVAGQLAAALPGPAAADATDGAQSAHERVTGSRAAQERLRQSEERYRNIFDSVSVSLWEEDMSGVMAAIEALRDAGVTDFRRYFAEHPDFVGRCIQLVRIVNVNEASLRMFGASDKDQLLRSLGDIFEERTGEVFAGALLALAEGQAKFEAEAPHRTLGGDQLSVLVSMALPASDEVSSSVLVSLTDITARKQAEDALKQSEAHFRVMADTAPAMLWITDDAAAVAFLSLGWYEFTGQPPECGSGTDWTSAVHPDDRGAAAAVYAAAHRAREAFRVEYRLRRADGQYRWVIDAARPRFDGTRRFVGHIGAVIDIHERREAEQALQHAYTSLEHTNRMKDEFLATLSHELRTPLNAVLGWARMLRMGTMHPDLQQRALESIERNGKAQLLLIEDLLDVSRIISGKLQLKSEVADLAQVVASAVDATRPTANAKGLVLEVEVDPAARILVTGDADRLQQVVWNLLSNAAKFTPAGGRIRVALTAADAHARIVIADTGQGISPAFLPYVFDRFRQEDGTLTRTHTGLGLGLSIARHLIEAHGGSIAADSPGEGQGATFAVTIPLTPGLSPPPAMPTGARVQLQQVLRGIRILVVDDDPEARELVRLMAELYGATVLQAGSAGEALHLVGRSPVDVIVADIGMPAQDGHTLMRALRALPADRGGRIPAIALTAHVGMDDRDRALDAGFTRHLPKPVEMELLAGTIAELCAARP